MDRSDDFSEHESEGMSLADLAARSGGEVSSGIVSPAMKSDWVSQMVLNDKGKHKLDATLNWMLALENVSGMAGVIGYDTFRHNITLCRRPPWEAATSHWTPRAIEATDRAHIVMWLENQHFKARNSTIDPVILAVAKRNSFDPLTDYLRSITWDGVPRIKHWLSTYLGAIDNDYAVTIGERFLISAVARGLRPGCKVDTMLVLEGPQGLRKSSALEALFSKDFFTDSLSAIGTKDAKMEMQGVWAIEMAEMDQSSKAEAGLVKQFLSQKVDRFRPPYAKDVIPAPRRSVLIGSINPDGSGYLRDPTGARRFWPIACTKIDIEAILCDRDQLWAEAVEAFDAGEPWWVQESEAPAVVSEQQARSDVDAWIDELSDRLLGQTTVTQQNAFKELHIEARDIDMRHSKRLASAMVHLGFQKVRDQSGGGDRIIFKRDLQSSAKTDDRW